MPFLFAVAGLAVLFLAHVAPFPFLLDALVSDRSRWAMPAGQGPPKIYLTFDDGPNPTAIDVLRREEVKATFFLIDRHVTGETAPIVRRMFEEGHGVALHSHTRALIFLPPEGLAQVLGAAADRIERLAGQRPYRALRPHAGWRGGLMYLGLARAGYVLVGWGWMLWDWDWYRRPVPERIASRIVGRVSSGDIVVLHDGHHIGPRADRQHTVEVVAGMVPDLKTKGFVFKTVCETLSDSETDVDPADRTGSSRPMHAPVSH